MLKKLVAIISTASLLIAPSAWAQCTDKHCVGKVAASLVYANGAMNLFMDGDENQLNCIPSENGKAIYIPADTPAKAELLAVITSAELTDTSLKVRIIDNGQSCRINYIHLVK